MNTTDPLGLAAFSDAQLRILRARETVARQMWLARVAVIRKQLAEQRGMAA